MFHTQTFLDSVGAVLSPCEMRRQCSKESHCRFIPHSHTADVKRSVVLRLQQTYTFHFRAPRSTWISSWQLVEFSAQVWRHGEFELQSIRVVGFLSATEPSFNELRQTFSVLFQRIEARRYFSTVLPRWCQVPARCRHAKVPSLRFLAHCSRTHAIRPSSHSTSEVAGFAALPDPRSPHTGLVGRIVSDVQPESSNGACGLMPKDIATWKSSSILPRAVSQPNYANRWGRLFLVPF